MKLNRRLALIFAFFLFACQPTTSPAVTIIDNGNPLTLRTDERIPSVIFARAGITLSPNDRVLLNGRLVALDQSIETTPTTLQIRRAVNLTIVTSQGQQTIQTMAFTVGEALSDAGYWLHAKDKIYPPAETPIHAGMTVSYSPSRELTIIKDERVIHIRSSAGTVGEALAEAGIPLNGLDYSFPRESAALPSDGQIRVVPVSESVVLAQKPIPFQNEFRASAEVELDKQEILQPGEPGLAVSRIRIHYEDGQEVSRATESETVVRPPETRIVGYGTKVVVRTAVVDGARIEYWRAIQMFATAYSPCRSAPDRCYSGTSSGKPVKKGVTAVRYNWYLNMQGQSLFIPGYGYATIEDVCGGCVGKPWIDLGYSDSDYQVWGSWVTVYFLTPVPANILYTLD